jgi:hypothetical protein
LTTPPDLGSPYGSEQQRAADRENLQLYWLGLELLRALADRPSASWSQAQRSLLPGFTRGGTEHPAERLKRWVSLYREELDLIDSVRDRLAHGRPVTDPELLAATWLARQALATAAGVSPGEVDQRWVQAMLARAAA